MFPRICLLVCVSLSSLHADVVPAPFFQEGAVIQRDRPVPVWGQAAPSEKVTVEFKGQKKGTTADASGRWRVDLDPMPAAAEPAEMKITGNNPLTISNILVGDVWICAGQSNMAWTVKNSKDPENETAAANYPLIRHFKTALTAAAAPQDSAKGGWEACSPETVGNFSAVAYYFGRELFQKLDVPIGLLNISYGGTPIESWISKETLEGNPAFPAIQARLKQDEARYPARVKLYQNRLAAWESLKTAAESEGKKFTARQPLQPSGPDVIDRFTLSGLYNAMVHPFIPASVRGVIWFQGEANVYRAQQYHQLFPALIQEWRKEFVQDNLPFYFVQMANQARESDPSGEVIAYLREAQMSALQLPNTAMAVSADIGDPNDNHFKNKQEVGRRLALAALAQVYNQPQEFSGPIARKFEKSGDSFHVTFDHADGLKLSGAGSFELAGSDKVFHPADATVQNRTIIVKSKALSDPVAVRYAWSNNPAMSLFNASGLPAPAFRSDDWLPTSTAPDGTDNAE